MRNGEIEQERGFGWGIDLYRWAVRMRGGSECEFTTGEYRTTHELDPQNPAYRQGYERLSKRLNH